MVYYICMNEKVYFTIETARFSGFSVYADLEDATKANVSLEGKVSKVAGDPAQGAFEVIWTDDRPMGDRPRKARFDGSYSFPSVFGYPKDFWK